MINDEIAAARELGKRTYMLSQRYDDYFARKLADTIERLADALEVARDEVERIHKAIDVERKCCPPSDWASVLPMLKRIKTGKDEP